MTHDSADRGVALRERPEATPRAPSGLEVADDFQALSTQVRAAGLLDRRPRYYAVKLVATVAAFAAGWLGLFVLGPSWAALGIAAFLGVMSTQLGFLGHDAGHGQIFKSRRANRRLGLAVGNGLIGMSLGWWVPKHSAHHAHPNEMNRDPDMGTSPAPGSAADRAPVSRVAQFLSRRQAELFVPLMLLRSTGLYVSGFQDLFRRRDRATIGEVLPLVGHFVVYLAAVLWVLPLPEAVAFIAVHQAVFSLYLGCSFAPNHKGMPIVSDDSGLGFAERQVRTARNVTGGRCANFVLGGLNYQIEHHLFPTMPRPNLARARELIRPFCLERGFGYCESSPVRSFRQVLAGLRAGTGSPLRAGAL
jgi:fatty acid desaturase